MWCLCLCLLSVAVSEVALGFLVVICFCSMVRFYWLYFSLSTQLRHSEMRWLLCGPPLSYTCFANFCNLVLANTFTITCQVHITMCHPYLTTGTLNSAQTHRLSRWVCSTKSVSLRCWSSNVHCALDVAVRYFSLWYDDALCVVYIYNVMFDCYVHLSHCNLHSLLCLGVVFTPMVKLHSMSKSTTGCTTGCVFFKFDVIFFALSYWFVCPSPPFRSYASTTKMYCC